MMYPILFKSFSNLSIGYVCKRALNKSAVSSRVFIKSGLQVQRFRDLESNSNNLAVNSYYRMYSSTNNQVDIKLNNLIKQIDRVSRPNPASSLVDYDALSTRFGQFNKACRNSLTALNSWGLSNQKKKDLLEQLILVYINHRNSLTHVPLKTCLDTMNGEGYLSLIWKIAKVDLDTAILVADIKKVEQYDSNLLNQFKSRKQKKEEQYKVINITPQFKHTQTNEVFKAERSGESLSKEFNKEYAENKIELDKIIYQLSLKNKQELALFSHNLMKSFATERIGPDSKKYLREFYFMASEQQEAVMRKIEHFTHQSSEPYIRLALRQLDELYKNNLAK